MERWPKIISTSEIKRSASLRRQCFWLITAIKGGVVKEVWFCRLEGEKAEVEKQKEYFAKMRAGFQPDGQRVRWSCDDGMRSLVRVCVCSCVCLSRMKRMVLCTCWKKRKDHVSS